MEQYAENLFLEKRAENPFYRTASYEICFRVKNINSSLFELNDEAILALGSSEFGDKKAALKAMTPGFQRKNDKWSVSKKIKFIENLFSGFKTNVYLFEINTTEHSFSSGGEVFVLDGLQRITAIIDFMMGKFEIFGGISYDQIKSPKIAGNTMLGIKLFTFKSISEACQFYIDINIGNTHSEDDIEKARRFLADH